MSEQILTALVFVGILATLLIPGVYSGIKLWRAAMLGDPRLRLVDVLQRRSANLGALDVTRSYGAVLAVRTCIACREKARCDAWLASGRREGFEAFCPNAGFVARSR